MFSVLNCLLHEVKACEPLVIDNNLPQEKRDHVLVLQPRIPFELACRFVAHAAKYHERKVPTHIQHIEMGTEPDGTFFLSRTDLEGCHTADVLWFAGEHTLQLISFTRVEAERVVSLDHGCLCSSEGSRELLTVPT